MRKTIAYLGYGLGLMLLVYYGLNYQEAMHIEEAETMIRFH